MRHLVFLRQRSVDVEKLRGTHRQQLRAVYRVDFALADQADDGIHKTGFRAETGNHIVMRRVEFQLLAVADGADFLFELFIRHAFGTFHFAHHDFDERITRTKLLFDLSKRGQFHRFSPNQKLPAITANAQHRRASRPSNTQALD